MQSMRTLLKTIVAVLIICLIITGVLALFPNRRTYDIHDASAYLAIITSPRPSVTMQNNLWGDVYDASQSYSPRTTDDVQLLSKAILDNTPPSNTTVKMNCMLVIMQSKNSDLIGQFRDLVWQHIDDSELKEFDMYLFQGTPQMSGLEAKSSEDRVKLLRTEKPITGTLILHLVTHEELLR